ncbi:hypothetical protein SH661x_003425 [Planctomicrobium sp. SH661]|uniref:hypothetical protein n=1 Tax=Planctomicrobium sp. SH661 TaxID=3448124 RepID=UPI003F5BB53B
MTSFKLLRACFLGTCLLTCQIAAAQQPSAAPTLQITLTQSAQDGKFTFIVFYRDAGDSLNKFHQQLQSDLAPLASQAVLTSAQVDSPAEQALVEKLGISRAPMPMAVVIAPNGAVTGLFPRSISADQIAASLVPPTMMRCMKELQEQKLVFVCLTKAGRAEVPDAVKYVQQLPQFKDRISVVEMQLDDPAEARFYQQMKVNASQVTGPYAVLIAPPGALIGHFTGQTTGEQLAAAIHKAGQCCDDPNCKHNHAPQASGPRPNAR